MAIEILLWRGKRLDDLVKYRLDMAEERLNSSRILLDAGQITRYQNMWQTNDMSS